MTNERWEKLSKEVLTCPRCAIEPYRDHINLLIWHENGHVWPGYAGEPTGDDFGGSDF